MAYLVTPIKGDGDTMSIKVMSWVWDNSPYDGKALLVHLALADFANDSGECWPSQTTLARKARCTDRHVRDVIRMMQTDGYIEIVKESDGVSSHRYKLEARNSLPDRNSTTPTPELGDTTPGNPTPKNRQEPSNNQVGRCSYCQMKVSNNKKHKCPVTQTVM